MTIVYPLTLPTGGRRSVEWRSISAVAMSMSPFTGQQQVIAHAGEMWAATVRLVPMQRSTAAAWIATLRALRGRFGTFHLGHPDGTAPRGNPQGTPLVNGAGQTGTSLLTDGWTASASGVLLKGDFIQFGSGLTRRVYQVLADVSADGTGAAAIDIYPRLRESPADNEPVVYNSTAAVFRLAENEMLESIDTAMIYGLEFAALEAL